MKAPFAPDQHVPVGRPVARQCLAAASLAICLALSAPAGAQTTARTSNVSVSVEAGHAQSKAWYETGLWPIVGGLAALIVTNAVAVGIVYLQASRGFNAVLRQRQIEALSASLTEFYNPIMALLDINGEVFEKTGPPSFPDGAIERDAAALVWAETKKVILENNRRILEILRTKTHRLHQSDGLVAYNDLMIHLAMYETFQIVPTDRYRDFQFPKKIREHVANVRKCVLQDFNALTGAQL